MAPVTPVVLLTGVSMMPTGFADVPVGIVTNVTAIGPAVLPAPLSAKVMLPVTAVDIGRPAGSTLTESSRAPVPDVGADLEPRLIRGRRPRDRSAAALRQAHRLRCSLSRHRRAAEGRTVAQRQAIDADHRSGAELVDCERLATNRQRP